MKLVKCNIINFGNLHECSFDFADGMTVICEYNSFGKTTLSEFICAMLYGFNSGGGINVRRKYAPWQGGEYGGSLVFEQGGKRYRVVRRFGATGTSGDKFALYDDATGSLSNDFSERLGYDIFKMDKQSFCNSIFLGKNVAASKLYTTDIHAILADLSANTGDLTSFGNAIKKLEEAKKVIRHEGNRGSDLWKAAQRRKSDLQNEKSRIEGLLVTLDKTRESAYACQLRQNELKQKQADVRERLTVASTHEAVNEKKTRYAELNNIIIATEHEIEKIKAKYGGNLITEDEANAVYDHYDEARMLNVEESKALIEAKQFNLKHESMPSHDEIDSYRNLLHECGKYSAAADACRLSEQEMAELNTLTEQKEVSKHKASPIKILLSMIGGVLIVVGAVLFTINSIAFGCMTFALGVVFLLAGAFLHFSGMIRQRAADIEQNNIRRNQLEKRNADEKINRALYNETIQKVMQFVNCYNGEADTSMADRALTDLHTDRLKFEDNEKLIAKETTELDAARQTLAEHKKEIGVFLKNHSIELKSLNSEFFRMIRDDAIALKNALATVNKQREDAAGYYAENADAINSTTLEEESVTSLKSKDASIADEMDRITNELAQLGTQIRSLSHETDRLPEISACLADVDEEMAVLDEHFNVLDATINMLNSAKENMANRFTEPIKRNLSRYLAALMNEDDDNIRVDAELKVTLNRLGNQRGADELSAGQADAVMLCMRMALADALFDSEPSFIILDDPFINLDDNGVREGLRLIESAAEHKQIIYLTCNTSRTSPRVH